MRMHNVSANASDCECSGFPKFKTWDPHFTHKSSCSKGADMRPNIEMSQRPPPLGCSCKLQPPIVRRRFSHTLTHPHTHTTPTQTRAHTHTHTHTHTARNQPTDTDTQPRPNTHATHGTGWNGSDRHGRTHTYTHKHPHTHTHTHTQGLTKPAQNLDDIKCHCKEDHEAANEPTHASLRLQRLLRNCPEYRRRLHRRLHLCTRLRLHRLLLLRIRLRRIRLQRAECRLRHQLRLRRRSRQLR